MFTAKRLVFYYAVSPVHMGAGSAIGAIDSPIQREVSTKHPMFAGSGIKGAVRHQFHASAPRSAGATGKPDHSLEESIFGPSTQASDFAGAISFGDAQLLAMPVRSHKEGFAYVTSPLCLARLYRLANHVGYPIDWALPELAEGTKALASTERLLSDNKLILEAFEFPCQAHEGLKEIGAWLAEHALINQSGSGPTKNYFAKKLTDCLVLLEEEYFSHFAEYAMVVEPHVRIDDETGTADDGALFYVENLPPESLMVGGVYASPVRKPGESQLAQAEDVLTMVFRGDESHPGIEDSVLQIGGDASTGRGLVSVRSVKGEPA